MRRGETPTEEHDFAGLTPGVDWYERGEGRRAPGTLTRVTRAVVSDIVRWLWWLRIPLLAPGGLFGASLMLLVMSPLLAIVLFAGYRKGERLQALKNSFASSPDRQRFTWQAVRPPRTHVIRNLCSLFVRR